MTPPRILFILSWLGVVSSQNPSTPPEDYVVKLKFSPKEERFQFIITELLQHTETNDISTRDIIRLSKMDVSNLDEVNQVLDYFHVSPTKAYTVDNLEHLLDALDIHFNDFYYAFSGKLNLTSDDASLVLLSLKIDAMKFMTKVASREYVYDVLRNGSYNQKHVDSALALLNKTRKEVFKGAKESILEKVLTFNTTHFLGVLKHQGWDTERSLKFWRAVNLTSRDVYNVEKFAGIFNNLTNKWNQNLTTAVVVGPRKLAVHQFAYEKLRNNKEWVNLKLEVNNNVEVELFHTTKLGRKILQLDSILNVSKYIEIAEDYNSSSNCWYVSFVQDQLRLEEIEVDNISVEEGDSTITVNKTSNTTFSIGNPLVCNDTLYGLAGRETESNIIFDKFFAKGEDDSPDSTSYTSPMSTQIFTLLICYFIM